MAKKDKLILDDSQLKLDYHITPDQVFITRDQGYPSVVSNMQDALRLFAERSWSRTLLPPLLQEAYVNCKTQELAVFQNRVSEFEIQTYRDRI